MGSVYVFGEPGMLIVKVGKSQCLVDRQRELRRQYGGDCSGTFLFVQRRIESGPFYGKVERLAHRYLRSRYWLHSEWFTCGADVARRAVKHAAKVVRKQRALYRREDREWRISREYQAYCRRYAMEVS
jgi:hypothetical protein